MREQLLTEQQNLAAEITQQKGEEAKENKERDVNILGCLKG